MAGLSSPDAGAPLPLAAEMGGGAMKPITIKEGEIPTLNLNAGLKLEKVAESPNIQAEDAITNFATEAPIITPPSTQHLKNGAPFSIDTAKSPTVSATEGSTDIQDLIDRYKKNDNTLTDEELGKVQEAYDANRPVAEGSTDDTPAETLADEPTTPAEGEAPAQSATYGERVQAFQEQQKNRPPEERRDELIKKAKEGALTAEEAQQLNDAKTEIAEATELTTLEAQLKDPNGAPLSKHEMEKYQALKEKTEPGNKPSETEAQALEKQSQQIVENIRNGEGNIMENVLQLEEVQRQMQGETLSKSMRNILAEALQSSIEGGDLDNGEAETVMEKISQLYGLEMQMAQLPDQYKQFESQADQLDKKIDKDRNRTKFDKSTESAKRRQEMYANYQRLTMVEAQMAQLMVIDKKLELKFKSIMNQLDFTLGRKNIVSYAVRGLANAGNRHLKNAFTPKLRSTRHRNLLGF